MAAKKIYSVYGNNGRIGSYSAEVAEKLLGIDRNKVSVYADQGTRYKGEYLFVAEDEKLFETEWDAARYKLLAGGRGKNGK